MKINSFIDQCTAIPDISVKKHLNSIEFNLHQPDGKGTLTLFSVFPGIFLGYIFINALTWPVPKFPSGAAMEKGPFIFNYCLSGRCDILLNNKTCVYLKDGEISLTECFAQSDYVYPQNIYEGIEIFIDRDSVSQNAPYIKEVFHIDFTELIDLYCPNGRTYIANCRDSLEAILHKIWNLYDENESFCDMQTATLELFSHLLHKQTPASAKTCDFFTLSQVEIAKRVQEIITSDLKKHHSIREMAEQFSVGETSIKKYFHGVFGQHISVYLRELRMNTAAKMLEEGNLSVSEIAAAVGYMNQSKFASVFKKQFGMSPLEYKRMTNLSPTTSFLTKKDLSL